MATPHSKADPYGASLKAKRSEGKGLLHCYDWMIESAAKHDAESLSRALTTLESSLDIPANPALAADLIKLYAYIRWCAERDNFSEVCRVVELLRDMWDQALST